MSIKRSAVHTPRVLPVAADVRLIGKPDLAMVQAAMADAAPDWSVELHGICSGEATLVVMPEDGDDETGPSFIISRETYGFRIDQVHWDAVTEIGGFATMSDIIDVLSLRLAFSARNEAPAVVTLH